MYAKRRHLPPRETQREVPLANASANKTTVSGGKVNIQDVSLTKYIDKATVPILLDCAAGTLITDATLVARRNAATPYIFLTYALQLADY